MNKQTNVNIIDQNKIIKTYETIGIWIQSTNIAMNTVLIIWNINNLWLWRQNAVHKSNGILWNGNIIWWILHIQKEWLNSIRICGEKTETDIEDGSFHKYNKQCSTLNRKFSIDKLWTFSSQCSTFNVRRMNGEHAKTEDFTELNR